MQQKIDVKLKEQWIAALRGGRYIKEEGKLYNSSYEDNTYHMCCLGVLEHICGTKPEKMDSTGCKDLVFPENLDNPKSPEIFWNEPEAEYLASINGGSTTKNINKHSFEEIADYIENYY